MVPLLACPMLPIKSFNHLITLQLGMSMIPSFPEGNTEAQGDNVTYPQQHSC